MRMLLPAKCAPVRSKVRWRALYARVVAAAVPGPPWGDEKKTVFVSALAGFPLTLQQIH